MKILLLGGTGAMGVPLYNLLKEKGHDVTVSSRSNHKQEGVTFVKGNALDINFVLQLMKTYYDVVVDFMVRSEEGTKAAMDIILPSCGQYIFLSSSRVFAPVDINKGKRITEESPRLLDVCTDDAYKKSHEYAIEKAREENLFFNSKYKNWTIIRPTLTYNTHRLQFAYGEKEDWLFRVLNGHSIVFPKDMKKVKTSMVFGDDVAKAISKLIGNNKALGTTVNVVSEESLTWEEVLKIYKEAIEQKTGLRIKIIYIEKFSELTKSLGNYYQVKYARAVDRAFSNQKLNQLIGHTEFTPIKEGLTHCMNVFLKDQNFGHIDWRKQAYYDKICREKTPLPIIPLRKDAITYFCYRNNLGWTLDTYHKLKYNLKNTISSFKQ